MSNQAIFWSDRYRNVQDLADQVAALGINGVSQIVAAIREHKPCPGPAVRDKLHDLADFADELADMQQRRGHYEKYVVLTDAGACLRMLADDKGEPETWGDDTMTVEVLTVRADD